jgi:hypothetical protein
MSLGRLRMAIRKNRISFPSQIPCFACQPKAHIQWRLAALFFIHGWPCTDLGPRYGLSVRYVQQLILNWARRAMILGYLEEIPAVDGPADCVGVMATSDPRIRANGLGPPSPGAAKMGAEAPAITAARSGIAVSGARA